MSNNAEPKSSEAEAAANAASEPAAEKAAEAATEADGAKAAGEKAEQPAERDYAAEAAELKNKLLHTLADMENLRQRTEREVADARKYAVSRFAKEVLTVGDNLRRAIDSVPEGARDNADLSSLLEGVEATARSLEQTLGKFGVVQIEALGKKFDPSMHEAMMEVDDPSAEPGTVAAELQTGFVIGERVLRPTTVSVVKKRKRPVVETKSEAVEATKATAEASQAEASSDAGKDKPADKAAS